VRRNHGTGRELYEENSRVNTSRDQPDYGDTIRLEPLPFTKPAFCLASGNCSARYDRKARARGRPEVRTCAVRTKNTSALRMSESFSED
jgi:hypothetical protein